MAHRRRGSLGAVLGPLEADVMEVVWRRGEVTVRDVQAELAARRRLAYTTIMTTMGRLADKGLLRRVESQPAHRYLPLVSRDQYAHTAVKSVLDWVVGHFREPAVAYFVDRVEKEDPELIESLIQAISQRERAGRAEIDG